MSLRNDRTNMTTEYFSTEQEAAVAASVGGGVVTRMDSTSFILDEAAAMSAMSPDMAAAVVAYATAYWGGSIDAALADASEGRVRGVAAREAARIDETCRVERVSTRWQVVWETAKTCTEAGDTGDDTGEAWGSTRGDGWRVDD